MESKTSKGVWPIRIITEGKGTSAIYLREMLEANKDVFAERAMFGNHPKDPNKPWERSPFEMKATLGPVVEYKVVDGVAGLWGEAIVDDEVDAFLEKFHKQVGVSIFASGESYEKDGEIYAESFDGTDPYTSVDFVVAPGRGGGVEQRMLEAYRVLENSAAADNGVGTPAADPNKKEAKAMDEKLAKLLEAFLDGVDARFTALEAKLDSVVTLSESAHDAEAKTVEALEVADALAEAELTESGRKRVIESLKAGTEVADAIATEKALRDEILAEADRVVQHGRFGEAADKTNEDYSVAGLRFN